MKQALGNILPPEQLDHHILRLQVGECLLVHKGKVAKIFKGGLHIKDVTKAKKKRRRH